MKAPTSPTHSAAEARASSYAAQQEKREEQKVNECRGRPSTRPGCLGGNSYASVLALLSSVTKLLPHH